MAKITDIITTQEAESGFYPTPAAVAETLLNGVDWLRVKTVLEPSAGKGDLIRGCVQEAIKKWPDRFGYFDRVAFEADLVEIDPYLRSILQYEFCGQREAEVVKRIREIDTTTCYGQYKDDSLRVEHEFLKKEKQRLKAMKARVVHDNFLTMHTRKAYDLIVMNPPFADGDAHLLKAIEMQRRTGGEIRCILNAETLLNPYTNRRKLLKNQLEELGAEVHFVDNGFSHGERETDVSVALIKLKVPVVESKSEFFERMKAAAQMEENPAEDVTDLSVTDFLTQIVTRYNVEVDTGLEMIREFKAMKPYVGGLTLSLYEGGRHEDVTVNGFLKKIRLDYWKKLLDAPQFTAKLTSKLKTKYRGMVDKLGDYDFSLFNIQQVATEMNAEMGAGIQDTILALFERFTTAHTWYPECSKNIHYFDGWKTNKAHKINKKVILPIRGVFADRMWNRETFDVRKAEETISDIEKVFDYLDGNMTSDVDLHGILKEACESGNTKNIQCKYFTVTLYKKGTMHIKFTNQDVLDRFNIYVARNKNWLPPSYGKKTYSNLNEEERKVVDGFQSAEEYNRIMQRADFFLASPVGEMLMLGA